MTKLKKLYFSKEEKAGGLSASKMPLESQEHYMKRLTKKAREKRQKEERKTPEQKAKDVRKGTAYEDKGGKLKKIKGGAGAPKEKLPPSPPIAIVSDGQVTDAQADEAVDLLMDINEGGKLKMKRSRKAKRMAKAKPKESKLQYKFNVGSEQPKLMFAKSEGYRLLPALEKRQVGVPPLLPKAKPKKEFLVSPAVQFLERERIREAAPIRSAELQFSGLPTLEEYQQNPQMFSGLLPAQKDELDRQLRERAGKSVSTVQDISDELKKIQPALTTGFASIIPFNAMPGLAATEPMEALATAVEVPPVEVPPVAEEEAFMSPAEEAPIETPKQRKAPVYITKDELAMSLISTYVSSYAETYAAPIEQNSEQAKLIGRQLLEAYEQGGGKKGQFKPEQFRREFIKAYNIAIAPSAPTGATPGRKKTKPAAAAEEPVGSALKFRGRPSKMKKANQEELLKHAHAYYKLSKKRTGLTERQKKKLDKYKKLHAGGVFDTLKDLASKGIKLGLKEGVKYLKDNPEKLEKFLNLGKKK